MDNNKFKCQSCGGTFNSQDELMNHAQKMHQSQTSEQEHLITCSKCEFKAKEAKEIEEHNKGHMSSGQM